MPEPADRIETVPDWAAMADSVLRENNGRGRGAARRYALVTALVYAIRES